MTRLVVIRIRGDNNVKPKAFKTLELMRLKTKFSCVIVNSTPESIGMIAIVKDLVTWGEINTGTLRLLLEKRGRLYKNKLLDDEYLKTKVHLNLDQFVAEFMQDKKELNDVEGLKKVFRLSPPRKGFERKGIKQPYSMGGSLGYRKEAINELLVRML